MTQQVNFSSGSGCRFDYNTTPANSPAGWITGSLPSDTFNGYSASAFNAYLFYSEHNTGICQLPTHFLTPSTVQPSDFGTLLSWLQAHYAITSTQVVFGSNGRLANGSNTLVNVSVAPDTNLADLIILVLPSAVGYGGFISWSALGANSTQYHVGVLYIPSYDVSTHPQITTAMLQANTSGYCSMWLQNSTAVNQGTLLSAFPAYTPPSFNPAWATNRNIQG